MLPGIRGASLAIGLSLSATVLLLAQPQAPAASAAESVPVDFFAIGPDGSVFDLRSDEVTIKIDSRPRRVRTLRYVNLSQPDAPGSTAAAAEELDPPFATNVLAPARIDS
jgi:hypothetical protein